MLEAVDQVAQDREPNPAMYRMLTGALHTLAATRNPLVTPAFFWKLLSLEGFHPLLDGCARCGEPDVGPEIGIAGETGSDHELVAFDLEEGGTVCRSCARGGGRPLTSDGLALLRRVLGGGLNGALAEAPGPAAHEVEHLGVRALEHHVERRLRSAVLL
jgi:DNA repair protein RecO (recombination protein O)